MSSTAPKRLLAALRAVHEAGKTFVETTGEVTVACVFNAQTASNFAAIVADPEVAKCGGVDVSDAMNRVVPPTQIATLLGSGVVVVVRKPNTAATRYFFQASTLNDLFDSESFPTTVRSVLIAEDFEEFTTLSCRFSTWVVPVEDNAEALPLDDVQPRRLVLEGGLRIVPPRVGQLLRVGPSPAPSTVYEAWVGYALRTLPLTLANEVRDLGDARALIFSGSRDVEITLDSDGDEALFEVELSVARWVFLEGASFETRWNLVTYELGRLWPTESTWSDGFALIGSRALDAAQSAYRLFLNGKSSDTLKALGELRKTLNDEVAKVMQQTRDLVSSLWRDFVIAATAFAARGAIQAATPRANIGEMVRVLLFGAAGFLAYSILVTIVSNAWFIHFADDSRKKWYSSAYGFVGADTYKELARVPLRNALRVYHWTSGVVGVAYTVAILFLILLASTGDVKVVGKSASKYTTLHGQRRTTPKSQPRNVGATLKPARHHLGTTP